MATLAERLVYGRPVDAEREYDEIRVARRPLTVLIGRIFLGAIFLLSGIMKFADSEKAAGYLQAQGVPYAHVLLVIAATAEVLGALAIITGFLGRLGALGLFLYLIPVTLVFHGFWNFTGQEQVTQVANFMKNLAIMGGLLVLFAYGPGRYSLDAPMRRPVEP